MCENMAECVKLISLSVPVTGGEGREGGHTSVCHGFYCHRQVCGPIRGQLCVQVTNQRPALCSGDQSEAGHWSKYTGRVKAYCQSGINCRNNE